MKIKLHPYLQKLLSKHFVQHVLPNLVFPISHPVIITQESFSTYWQNELTLSHRKQSMCFFMEEVIEMVNKTNSRLLYEDLVTNIKNKDKMKVDDDEDKYMLLNVFEMLWNVDPSSGVFGE